MESEKAEPPAVDRICGLDAVKSDSAEFLEGEVKYVLES